MAEIKIVDGAIRLPDTVKNREKVKKFLRKLIDDKGLKVKGSGKPSKNFKEFPKVYFDGKLTEFRNKAKKGDLSNKFEFANEPARTAEKNLRKQDIADANELYSKEEVLEGQAKQKQIRKSGMEADHLNEVQEFGPARRNLEHERKSGLITETEYKRQLKIQKDSGVGDIVKNTGEKSQSSNLIKQDEVLKKNKGLAILEAKNISNRYKNNLFIIKDRLFKQAKTVLKPKNLIKLGIGTAALNSQSAEAASSMLAGGANKEDIAKFFKGIGNDLKGQLTIAAASKLLNGAGTSLNGLSSTVAPLLIGWQGKQLGDSILRGANGEDLKSQGKIAEAGKKYRKANGWSNGKSSRQNARHGTGLKVNREMIDDYNLNNGKNDSEFYENYRFNQAMNKLMREQKKV